MNKAFSRLQSRGLRATVARLQLLSILEETGRERMTAETIFMKIAAGGGSLSLASIYRVLKELSIHGLVERGWYKDGREIRLLFSLGLADGEQTLPEVVCTMCKRSMDVPLPTLRCELNQLAAPRSLQPDGRPIVIYVTCPECAQQWKKPA